MYMCNQGLESQCPKKVKIHSRRKWHKNGARLHSGGVRRSKLVAASKNKFTKKVLVD